GQSLSICRTTAGPPPEALGENSVATSSFGNSRVMCSLIRTNKQQKIKLEAELTPVKPRRKDCQSRPRPLRFRFFAVSHLKYYANTLASGYALLAANSLYTLASVPLAFRYLTRAEYGLWATTSQVVMYLSCLDLGMNTSIGRVLVDHKDRKDLPEYGSVLQ